MKTYSAICPSPVPLRPDSDFATRVPQCIGWCRSLYDSNRSIQPLNTSTSCDNVESIISGLVQPVPIQVLHCTTNTNKPNNRASIHSSASCVSSRSVLDRGQVSRHGQKHVSTRKYVCFILRVEQIFVFCVLFQDAYANFCHHLVEHIHFTCFRVIFVMRRISPRRAVWCAISR